MRLSANAKESNKTEFKRNRMQPQWNAKVTERKRYEMQTQQNGNATQQKINDTKMFSECKHNGRQMQMEKALNANGTGTFL